MPRGGKIRLPELELHEGSCFEELEAWTSRIERPPLEQRNDHLWNSVTTTSGTAQGLHIDVCIDGSRFRVLYSPPEVRLRVPTINVALLPWD